MFAYFNDARVEARDVEQRVEQAVHCARRGFDLLDQPHRFRRQRYGAQRADEETKGVNRLAQIMAGGRQKPRLVEIGLFDEFVAPSQIIGEVEIFEAQAQSVGVIGVEAARHHKDNSEQKQGHAANAVADLGGLARATASKG